MKQSNFDSLDNAIHGKVFYVCNVNSQFLKLTKCEPLITEPLEEKKINTHAVHGQLKINFHAVLSVNNWNLFASED